MDEELLEENQNPIISKDSQIISNILNNHNNNLDNKDADNFH